MKKRRLKKKFVVFFSLYFMLLTLYLAVVTFSKYIGSIEKEKSVGIAKWDIQLSEDSNSTIDVILGNSTENLETQSYVFTITNTSEVASTYSIKLTNVPDNLQVIVDNDETYNEENNEIVINELSSFDAGDLNSVHNHTLTFIAPQGTEEIENQEIDLEVTLKQVEL